MAREVDDLFENELLASLYDYFNPWSASDGFYLDIAKAIGGRVMDVGCGTGMLACRIAAEDMSVTGIDPAIGMLRVARAREGAERVTWINADGQTMDLGDRFDCIYMTGHAFQALVDEADTLALLRNVRRHLAGGGRFVFETRNPSAREWLTWTPERRRTALTREHGRIEEFCEHAADENTGVIELRHTYRFLDEGRTSVGTSRLRFIDRSRLELFLTAANLTPVAWYGDWDRAEFTSKSKEIIVVARSAG
jgi:SAM-dependent methyltransferase